MKVEASMSAQPTGMPRAVSAEPHRPGAISKHFLPSARSCALIALISAAMAVVFSGEKRPGGTKTTSRICSKRPWPSACFEA